MHGFHSLGGTPSVEDDDVEASAPALPRPRLCPSIEHVAAIRLPKKRTAFTDAALRLELVARIESARPAQSTRSSAAVGARGAKPARWCGASPLERKRAAWRERRRQSR
jgi:hypothetical protein